MPNIQELAREVDRAQDALNRAQQRLLAALTGNGLGGFRASRAKPESPAPTGRKGPKPDSGSTSQQVLAAIVAAGPGGIARRDLVSMNLGTEAAIHSALKKHKGAGAIENRDEKWMAVSGSETPKRAKGSGK